MIQKLSAGNHVFWSKKEFLAIREFMIFSFRCKCIFPYTRWKTGVPLMKVEESYPINPIVVYVVIHALKATRK